MDNPYQEIDGVIAQWAERHGFTLFTHIQGHAGTFRIVYLGSTDECCQIWIDPPENGAVGVHAADVESRNDEPMRADWTSPVPALASTLELAVGMYTPGFPVNIMAGKPSNSFTPNRFAGRLNSGDRGQ